MIILTIIVTMMILIKIIENHYIIVEWVKYWSFWLSDQAKNWERNEQEGQTKRKTPYTRNPWTIVHMIHAIAIVPHHSCCFSCLLDSIFQKKRESDRQNNFNTTKLAVGSIKSSFIHILWIDFMVLSMVGQISI